MDMFEDKKGAQVVAEELRRVQEARSNKGKTC